jgi:uncharacterized BrkB/YihY/UPF0761 family membrane protein
MTLISLIVLIVVVGLVIWLVPQVPPPWRWIVVAVMLVVCLYVLFLMLGVGGLRLR